MKIEKDDVVVVYVDENELVCMTCMHPEELDGASADDVLTRQEIDDGEKLFFCDRCRGRVK
mgnify:CR=1 FL=1